MSRRRIPVLSCCDFFFNDTATTEIYTLSLHDALPICGSVAELGPDQEPCVPRWKQADRKSTRLNSSHLGISYAVFCLKKKNTTIHNDSRVHAHLLGAATLTVHSVA